jgi:hypothetical protein
MTTISSSVSRTNTWLLAARRDISLGYASQTRHLYFGLTRRRPARAERRLRYVPGVPPRGLRWCTILQYCCAFLPSRRARALEVRQILAGTLHRVRSSRTEACEVVLQRWSRRSFLNHSGAVAVATWIGLGPARGGERGAPQRTGWWLRGPQDPLETAMLGYATAYEESRRSGPKQRELLTQLAYIASQRIRVAEGRATEKEAVQAIRRAVESGRYQFPDTFGAVAKAMQAGPDSLDLFSVPVRSGLAAGTGALGAAFTFGLANPPSLVGGIALAGVLGMLGVGVDQLGSEIGGYLHDKYFPPASDAQVFALTAWASSEFYRSLNDSTAYEIGQQLNDTGHLRIRVDRDAKEASRSLPQSLRETFGSIANSGIGGRNLRATEKAVNTELERSVARLDARTEELAKYLRTEEHRAAQLRASESERLAIQQTALEIESVGAIGHFLLGHVFRAPELGKAAATYATSVSSIFMTLGNPSLGPIAVAGTLAKAADSILSLGLSATDPLLATLKPIEKHLEALVQGLQYISSTQREILRQIAEVYRDVSSSRALLVRISDQIYATAAGAHDEHIALAQESFSKTREQLAVLLDTTPVQTIVGDPNLKARYVSRLSECADHATSTARNAIFAESPSPTLSRLDLTARMRASLRCDQLIGFIQLLGREAGVAGTQGDPQNAAVANPLAWAEGVETLLHGHAMLLGEAQKSTASLLERPWQTGMQIRELVRTSVTPTVVTFLRQKLLTSLGLPLRRSDIHPEGYSGESPSRSGLAWNIVERARAWDTANVPRSSNVVVHFGRVQHDRYVIFEGVNMMTLTVNHDFLKEALDLGFIQLTDRRSTGVGRIETVTLRVVADGPWTGSSLGTVSILDNFWFIPEYTPYDGQTGYRRGDPLPVQSRVMPIVLKSKYRPEFMKVIPEILTAAAQQHLASAENLEFEYWGELARTFAAFARWRSADARSTEALSTSSVSGPFSLRELLAPIGVSAHVWLSFAGYWPGEVALAMHDSISSACDLLMAELALTSPDKSLNVVDETLRLMAGYLSAREIDVPDNGENSVGGSIRASAPTGERCEWRGSAPFCGGECAADEREASRNDRGDGYRCVTGTKAYCCH